MKKNSSANAWYINLFKILKLETTTPRGKVNLAGVFVLAIFCLIYTGGDVLIYLISAVSDTIKSIALKQDIYHPYSSINVFKAVSPILLGFVICLLFLWLDDRKRNNLKPETQDEVQNPLENI